MISTVHLINVQLSYSGKYRQEYKFFIRALKNLLNLQNKSIKITHNWNTSI
jgi:hypothetical protein